MTQKEKLLRKVAWRLRKVTGISPNGLSFIRVFGTPWILLLLIETLSRGNGVLGMVAVAVYFFVVLTDFFDGPLAREMEERGDTTHDVHYGSALDRISDKLLVVFSLIPFGAHPLIVLIVIGESALLYQALYAKDTKKRKATYIGKVKMFLQTFLMPFLLMGVFYENLMLSRVVLVYMGVVALFTMLSIVSHYRK